MFLIQSNRSRLSASDINRASGYIFNNPTLERSDYVGKAERTPPPTTAARLQTQQKEKLKLSVEDIPMLDSQRWAGTGRELPQYAESATAPRLMSRGFIGYPHVAGIAVLAVNVRLLKLQPLTRLIALITNRL